VVVFDTSTIVLALDPKALPPINPATNRPVEKCKERVEHLLATLHKAKTPILIPTPVLGEFLVKAGPNKQDYLAKFLGSRNFEVGVFDVKAAIEIAELLGDPDLHGKKKLDDKTTKAKIKFDRQIVAIAKVCGASLLYTDDGTLATVARNNRIAAVMTWEIPLPPLPPNLELDLKPREET
jgi:hypothetical protein